MPPRARTIHNDSTRPTCPARDTAITNNLEQWFARAARPLPWRAPPHHTAYPTGHPTSLPPPRRSPYHALVSEAMLQQTQVARVLDFFARFIERFPTVHALAQADEQAVLAAWAGLGYYRRAKQLHAAARAIVNEHDGTVPADPLTLRALPGVGRYTAGAIASIVYAQRTPLVDGNVARVLLRLEGQPMPLAQPATDRWAWQRAEQLVNACHEPAAFNEALMELGALICTPKQPDCPNCPLRPHCAAHAANTQHTIPIPKPAAAKRTIFAEVLLATVQGGGIAIQQRPSTGLWASMWQLPTHEHSGPALTPDAASARFNLGPRTPPLAPSPHLPPFTHQTTHRTLHFQPWQPTKPIPRSALPPHWTHIHPDALPDHPMSNPQRRLATKILEER